MKNSILCLLLGAMLFVTCKEEKPQPDLTDAQNTSASTDKYGENVPQEIKDAASKPINPFPTQSKTPLPQLERAKQTLIKNYWIVNAYLKIKDFAKNRANQGRWYKFREDGTFTVGQFENEISTGTWDFFYADSTGQVSLDAKETSEDGLWNVKFASDESLMIWVGTEQFQTNGVQQRLENLLFIPKNRKEMGLKE